MLVKKEGSEISKDRFTSMIKNGINGNGVIFDDDSVNQMVDTLMDECGSKLTFENIQNLFKKFPELGGTLSFK